MIELPCEILVKIASFTSQTDKLQCSFVCKTWCRPFQESLWNTIEVKTTHRINEICKSPISQNIYRTNGHLVWKLLLGNSACVKDNELFIFQQQFTNLRYLNIPCGSLNRTNFGNTTQWSLWKSLTCLCIHIPFIKAGKDKRILDIIPNLPNLKRLDFEDDGWDERSLYTLQDIERIHSFLPRLKCLSMGVKLVPIPMETIDYIKQVSSARNLTRTTFVIRKMDITWLCYFSAKYPNMNSLNWRIKYHTMLAEDETRKALDILSDRPCLFPNLKKVVFEEISGSSAPDPLFWNMLAKFPRTIGQFKYLLNGRKVTSQQVQALSSRCQTTWAATLKSIWFRFPESLVAPTKTRICFGALPALVDLHVNLLSGWIEVDILLNNCPAMKILYLEGGSISLSPSAADNTSRHGLEDLKLISMETHSTVFRHLSVRCRGLNDLRLKNMRMQDIFLPGSMGICLDMPFTHLKRLSFLRIRLLPQFNDKHGLMYTDLHNIQLLVIEQTEPGVNSIDLSTKETSQTNMASTSWFHHCRATRHSRVERSVWMLGEQDVREAESYFSSSSGASQEMAGQDTTQNCFGLVEKSSWKDDLLRGYIRLRCKSVSVCNIDGSLFYGGI
ncbi:hypothetical protein CLU79DRAFT_765565 [Phycomyces nitens]|nr:hypothetical protein CLU79DRAFT_765565 [Phycomyces nitens]